MADNDTSQVDRPDHDISDDPYQSDDDNDSAMGESIASSTCSLSPSVAQYEYQHGRRYHAFRAGRYYMPNDETEQDLMDVTHYISLAVKSSLLNAPDVETHIHFPLHGRRTSINDM